MSLADRVKAAKAAEVTFDGQREEMRQELRRKLHYKVVEGLGPTLYDRQMSDAELKLRTSYGLSGQAACREPTPSSWTRPTSSGSLRRSSARWVGASMNQPRWSMLASPTVLV